MCVLVLDRKCESERDRDRETHRNVNIAVNIDAVIVAVFIKGLGRVCGIVRNASMQRPNKTANIRRMPRPGISLPAYGPILASSRCFYRSMHIEKNLDHDHYNTIYL